MGTIFKLFLARKKQFFFSSCCVYSCSQIEKTRYASNQKANWKAKDVAVFLLTAVAVSTFRQATGASTVNPMVPLLPFYQNSVLPDLAPNSGSHPILQADALKFVITFRTQIPANEYGRLLPLVVGMLRSPVVVVHTYAACALDNMMTVKDASPSGGGYTHRISKENLEPVLKDLLGGLFGVFKVLFIYLFIYFIIIFFFVYFSFFLFFYFFLFVCVCLF